MKNGIEHSIPISASFNLLNYINLSPSVNYNEKWYFKKVEFEWNPVTNQTDTLPTNYGFYRLYNYNFSVSASTTVYGMYDFTKKSRDRKIQAIRHTLTPSIGFSYAPDFSDPKYGYYKTRQTDSTGRFTTYSPYAVNAYGVPSSGRSMSMNFSLSQNLEMKVLSKRDTSGVKKIKLIDELRISGSYNFLADSMGLSNIPVSFRTTLFNNFGINLSLTLDPYRVSPEGKRYNKLFFPGRVVSTGWSFGYTFKSRNDRSETAINDITSIPPEYQNPFYDPYGQMDPVLCEDSTWRKATTTSRAVELRIQLRGQLLDLVHQQRHDGLPEERHPNHRLQRFAERHPQDGHHLPGRLRHQGQQTDHLVGLDHARPPLLADVLFVDSVRLPPFVEFQHRRQGRIALRPEIRQIAVDVRQYVLTHTRLYIQDFPSVTAKRRNSYFRVTGAGARSM